MKIKMVLPALTEAKSPYWRPIKYSLFPPPGLATLAAYCDPGDEIDLQDEHVEQLNVDDPDAFKRTVDWAYQSFYSWRNILQASLQHESLKQKIKHFTYAGGWKKFEPLWNFIIKTKGLNGMLPLLEAILSKVNGDKKKQSFSPFPGIA
jgi:hypothetical protein